MFTSAYIPKRTYAPESLTIFAAASAPLSTPRKRLIDACVRSLKTGGVWTKLDFLHVFAANESQLSLVNWKNPGTYNATTAGSPTFTANVGYAGDGVDNSITSSFNPTSAGGNYTQNSAHIGVWVHDNVSEDKYMCGPASTAGAQLIAFINPRSVADTAVMRINDATSTAIASTDSIGHWIANRSGASAREFYKNGSSILTDSAASTGINNTSLVCLRGSSLYSTRTARAFHAGSSLTSGEASTLYTALNTYMSGL